ncbi:Zinc finger protein [Plakobranchus ocellatus]|uniref:Zinc finger protein n=1 Tax=Plakobranchus ocellatus TaxID=259542 RepID=A0AAV4E0T5_9GAST|nr:Zinc finger protein [Plakobranchus ocellatus]
MKTCPAQDGTETHLPGMSHYSSADSGIDSAPASRFCYADTRGGVAEVEHTLGLTSDENYDSHQGDDRGLTRNVELLQSVGLFPKVDRKKIIRAPKHLQGLGHLQLAYGGEVPLYAGDGDLFTAASECWPVSERRKDCSDEPSYRTKISINPIEKMAGVSPGKETEDKPGQVATCGMRKARNRKSSRPQRLASHHVKDHFLRRSSHNKHSSCSSVSRIKIEVTTGSFSAHGSREYSDQIIHESEPEVSCSEDRCYKNSKSRENFKQETGEDKCNSDGPGVDKIGSSDPLAVIFPGENSLSLDESKLHAHSMNEKFGLLNDKGTTCKNERKERSSRVRVKTEKLSKIKRYEKEGNDKQYSITQPDVFDNINESKSIFRNLYDYRVKHETNIPDSATLSSGCSQSCQFVDEKCLDIKSKSQLLVKTEKSLLQEVSAKEKIHRKLKTEESSTTSPGEIKVKQENMQEYELDQWCDLGPTTVLETSPQESIDVKDIDIESLDHAGGNGLETFSPDKNDWCLSSTSAHFKHVTQPTLLNHGTSSAFHRPIPVATVSSYASHPVSASSQVCSIVASCNQVYYPTRNYNIFPRPMQPLISTTPSRLPYSNISSIYRGAFPPYGVDNYMPELKTSFSTFPRTLAGSPLPLHFSSVDLTKQLGMSLPNYNQFQISSLYQPSSALSHEREAALDSNAENLLLSDNCNASFEHNQLASSSQSSRNISDEKDALHIPNQPLREDSMQQTSASAAAPISATSKLRKRRRNTVPSGDEGKFKIFKHDDDFIDPTRMKFGHDDDEDSEVDELTGSECGLGESSDEEWKPDNDAENGRNGDEDESGSELDDGSGCRDDAIDNFVSSGRCRSERDTKSIRSLRKKVRRDEISDRSRSKHMNCSTCGKICYGNYQLRRHQMSHSEHRPHRCSQCGKGFKQKAHLQGHVKSVHSKTKHMQTEFDQVSGKLEKTKHATSASLKRLHKKPMTAGENENNATEFQNTEKGPIECETSAAQTDSGNSEKDMAKHVRQGAKTGRPKSARKVRDFSCHICNKAFKTAYRLKRHEQSHTDVRPYACRTCDKRFKQSGHRNEHEANHERQGVRFLCNKCGFVFRCRSSFNTHMRAHGQEQRRLCQTEEERKAMLCKEGDGFRLSPLSPREDNDLMSTAYDCPYCVEGFSTAQALNNHLDTHVEIAHRRHVQPYSCDVCRRTFTYRHNLAKHILMHKAPEKLADFYKEKIEAHLASGKPSYKCDHCSKVFIRKETLAKHKKIHTGAKPFKCSICSQSFSQNIHLKVHMRKHTGSRPFQCRECGKGFIDSTALAKHIEYEACNSDNYIYHCRICDKRHYYLGSIKAHMRRDHRVEDETVHSYIERTERVIGKGKKSINVLECSKNDMSKAAEGGRHQCKICARAFKEKCNLLRHIRRKHVQLVKLLGCSGDAAVSPSGKTKNLDSGNSRLKNVSIANKKCKDAPSPQATSASGYQPVQSLKRSQQAGNLHVDDSEISLIEGRAIQAVEVIESENPSDESTGYEEPLLPPTDSPDLKEKVSGDKNLIVCSELLGRTSVPQFEKGKHTGKTDDKNEHVHNGENNQGGVKNGGYNSSDVSSPSENFLYKIGLTVSTKGKLSTGSAISGASRPPSELSDNVFVQPNVCDEERENESRIFESNGYREDDHNESGRNFECNFTDTISVIELGAKHVFADDTFKGESFVVDLNKLEVPVSNASKSQIPLHNYNKDCVSETGPERLFSTEQNINTSQTPFQNNYFVPLNTSLCPKDNMSRQCAEGQFCGKGFQNGSSKFAQTVNPVALSRLGENCIDSPKTFSPVPLDLSQVHLRPVSPCAVVSEVDIPQTVSGYTLAAAGCSGTTADVVGSAKESSVRDVDCSEVKQHILMGRGPMFSVRDDLEDQNNFCSSLVEFTPSANLRREVSNIPNLFNSALQSSCSASSYSSSLASLSNRAELTSALKDGAHDVRADNHRAKKSVHEPIITNRAGLSKIQAHHDLPIHPSMSVPLYGNIDHDNVSMQDSTRDASDKITSFKRGFSLSSLTLGDSIGESPSIFKPTAINSIIIAPNHWHTKENCGSRIPFGENPHSAPYVSYAAPYNFTFSGRGQHSENPNSIFSRQQKTHSATSSSVSAPCTTMPRYDHFALHGKLVGSSNLSSNIIPYSNAVASTIDMLTSSTTKVFSSTADFISYSNATDNALQFPSGSTFDKNPQPPSTQFLIDHEERPSTSQLKEFANLMSRDSKEQEENALEQKSVKNLYIDLKKWLKDIGGSNVDRKANKAKGMFKANTTVDNQEVSKPERSDCSPVESDSPVAVLGAKGIFDPAYLTKQSNRTLKSKESAKTIAPADRQPCATDASDGNSNLNKKDVTINSASNDSRCPIAIDWINNLELRNSNSGDVTEMKLLSSMITRPSQIPGSDFLGRCPGSHTPVMTTEKTSAELPKPALPTFIDHSGSVEKQQLNKANVRQPMFTDSISQLDRSTEMSASEFSTVLGLTGTFLETPGDETIGDSRTSHARHTAVPGLTAGDIDSGFHTSRKNADNSNCSHSGSNESCKSNSMLEIDLGPRRSRLPRTTFKPKQLIFTPVRGASTSSVWTSSGTIASVSPPSAPDSTVKSGSGFACDQCGKMFNARHRLKRHELTHTNFRPFTCGQCGRAFRQKVHLSDHIKRHAGDRPFACGGCGKRFILKNEMNQHIKHYCCGPKKEQVRGAVGAIARNSLAIGTSEGANSTEPFSKTEC